MLGPAWQMMRFDAWARGAATLAEVVLHGTERHLDDVTADTERKHAVSPDLKPLSVEALEL
jgi:hypothetical protein